MHFDVKTTRELKRFARLLTGRHFLWTTDPKERNAVWYKINKNLAQDITDENSRRRFSEHDMITEVSLIQREYSQEDQAKQEA